MELRRSLDQRDDYAILLVIFGLMGGVLTPADRRLAQLAERDANSAGGPSADYERERRRAGLFGGLALLP